MPSISSRMGADLSGYTEAASVSLQTATPSPSVDASLSHVYSTSTRLVSPYGNRVPMRGVMPVEYSSDCDLMNYLPYSAYHDKMWAYTYQALANQRS